MEYFKVKTKKFSGTNSREIRKKALLEYNKIKKQSRRKPYIRSKYFKKEKIFLDIFWEHLYGKKNPWDRMRRLKYFACGIELIQKSNIKPLSKENPNNKSEILHRFAGITPENELFLVQIKENKSTKKKYFISVFPYK